MLFPNGIYYTPRADVTDPNSWLLIEKSNVILQSENKHGATLKNIITLAKGAYGSKSRLADDINKSGIKLVTTQSANGASLDSWVQLISAVSPYSIDAGEWQNGSINPSFATRPDAAFTEFLRVAKVNSSTSFECYSEIVFPVYKKNTEGQVVTTPGIEGAWVRNVDLLDNIVFDGLVFDREDGKSFRGIYFQLCNESGFRNCTFLTKDGDPGTHYRAEESVGFFVDNCVEFRSPLDATGSGWNSGVIAGGCQNSRYTNNRTIGGSQTLDVTPALDRNLLFNGERDIGPEDLYLSCHGIHVSGNQYYAAGDAFTTHPASYFLTYTGNTIYNGESGCRIRSRHNIITGNIINTRREGIVFSSFYDDTLISGNQISQLPDPEGRGWNGVYIASLSSETVNNNNTKNFFLTGNIIKADNAQGNVGYGFRARNHSNGELSLPEFDSNVKAMHSEIVVKDNEFINCGALINRFFNGIELSGNTFRGSISYPNWVESEDIGTNGNKVWKNKFLNPTPISIKIGTPADLPYNGGLQNYLSDNEGIGVFSTLAPNLVSLESPDFSNTNRNALTLVNGGSVAALRLSGEARLNLMARPLDGDSRARVNINGGSGTSDNRTYITGHHVQEGITWFSPDNTHSLGTASYRPSEIFAANGTINTSDIREKEQQRISCDAEKKVAEKLKSTGQFFKWTASVNKKGENARWNFGWMAQEVCDVFTSEGLDAHDYGMFCYDEWQEEVEETDEETGEVTQEYRPAGNRYGLRMDQLIAFIVCNT